MEKNQAKKPWTALKVVRVGHVAEVVKGGGGKLSPTTGDSGDIGKPPGQG